MAVVSTGQPEKGLGDPCHSQGQCGAGDPVSVAGGNVFEQVVDYQTEAINPLAFIRYYNSRPLANSSAVALGTDWRTNYDRYLYNVDSTHIAAERADGQVIIFGYEDGNWIPDDDVNLTLIEIVGEWLVTDLVSGTVETYNNSGILTSIELLDTYTQTLNYTSGKLTSVTDSQNRTLTMTYTGSLLQTVTTPDGLVLTYGYDASGQHGASNDRLHTVSYNTSPTTTITYAHVNTTYPFAVTSLTDELGNVYASWTYDAYGRGVTSKLNGGADGITVSYDDTTGERTVINPLSLSTQYDFQFHQGLQKVTELERAASGSIPAANSYFTYDSNGFLASKTDWNGNQTTYVNNDVGLPTKIVEPGGRTTTIAWDSLNPVPLEIDTARNTTTYSYDASGNMTGRTVKDVTSQSVPYSTNGQRHVSTYTYDSLGHVLTATDPLSHTTTYTYDSHGNLSTVKDPLGHVTTYSNYTGRGQPQAVTDPNGTVTSLTYDKRGRLLTRVVSPSGGNAITTYIYDAAGQLYDVYFPDGTVLAFNYDEAHRVVQVFNNFGESLDYYLNNVGGVLAEEWTNYPGDEFRVHYSDYDTLGRKTQDFGAIGQTTTYSYDSNGNRTGIVDPLSNRTTLTYDALNRLVSVKDPLSHTTTYAYDSQDNRTTVKDPRSLTTSYVYDGFGQVIQEVSPDRGTIVYVRDKAGNVTSETDGRGVVTSYSFDALNRVTTQTYPADSSNNITYTYDATAGGNKGIGHLTGYSDESGRTTLTYDERGNLTVKARTIGSQSYTTTYTYNLADRLTQAVYPSGRIVTYTYDAVGQMSGVSTKAGGTTTPLASNVTYYPFGPLNHIDYGNGLTGTFTSDTDYRTFFFLVAGPTLNVQLVSLGLDNADNPTVIYDSFDTTRIQTLTYDADYRLTKAIGKYGTITYTYDADGNRTTRIAGGTTTTYTYPGTSNLLSSTSGGAAATYTYDGAGNVTRDTSGSGNTYTYEKRGRYHALNVGGTATGTYLYDAVGERVSKQAGGSTTHYQYDESGHIIGENNGSTGANIREYVWLDNKPLAQIESGGTVYYIHNDQVGAPQKMTDATPSIVWDRIQQPFGETYSISGSATGNLRFPGQYFDTESGLNYNMLRDYNPKLPRYIESDPIGLAGSSAATMNIHGYASQNPVRFIDPYGLKTVVIFSGPGNPFGHVAMGFTGQGIYSYGTADPYGGSVTNYVQTLQASRSGTAIILDTTSAQEQTMMDFYLHNYNTPGQYSVTMHNCATAASGALDAAGIGSEFMTNSDTLPPGLPLAALEQAMFFPSPQFVQIPQRGGVPTVFQQFNK